MYVDASVVAKLYFPEADSDLAQRVVSDEMELVCSELLITEFASVASRKHRDKDITARQQDRVQKLFGQHVDEGYLSLIPLTNEELALASDLIRRCQNRAALRTLDAIHLATCIGYSQQPLLTTDRVMITAAKHLGVRLRELA